MGSCVFNVTTYLLSFFILVVIYSMWQNTKINKCTPGLSFDRSHVVDPHLHKTAVYFAV